MTDCHYSCQTCLSPLFTDCKTCDPSMLLIKGSCICILPWQPECTHNLQLRGLVMLLNMLIQLYIVGIMVLYVLRIRLPISYRIYSGLGGLSLLIYNKIFYMTYEDEISLKALVIANGPYFSQFIRVHDLSLVDILPTVVILIIMVVMVFLLYFPMMRFNRSHPSIQSYIINEGPNYFDCANFFVSRMMFFFVGKMIEQKNKSVISIVVAVLYGIFIVGACFRCLYQYHKGTLVTFVYDSPIYLYTILQPISMIGLMMGSSFASLAIVYASPFGLLILILLLNRNMLILTKRNLLFVMTEILMAALTILFIYLSDGFKIYALLITIIGSEIAITAEVVIVYYSGFEMKAAQVSPVIDQEEYVSRSKQMYGIEKEGYF